MVASPLARAGDSERMIKMRRAMRVMTASVLTLGVAAVLAQADRPAIRDAKGSVVTLHRASAQPAEGLRKETLASGQVIYVSPAPVANSMEILEVNNTEQGTTLRISGDAAARLDGQVAVFINDKLASVGPITQDGQVTLGRLTPDQADRLSRIVTQPSVPVGGPVLTVVPAGQRDGLYLVDVFVQGADDLRIYQVSLQVGGGTAGRLQLENVVVDQSRPDYVFGQAHIVEASSPRTGWLTAVLYEGSVKVTAPKYLGTYSFRPTPDATGTFRINVNLGEDTLLADGANENFNFSSGADARITVGARPTRINE